MHSRDVEALLDRHRYAVQRPDLATCRDRAIRLGRCLHRVFHSSLDHRVHDAVATGQSTAGVGRDPREHSLGHLA
jgi:hypothetical protein